MKKALLVTLADKNYIDQAKQLFSSVYFNAGWRGDYMLLAHEIPTEKLKWFRDKGILIKKCEALYKGHTGRLPLAVLSKFYMFTPEFKKWGNVVYLDADMIVRASLDNLLRLKGFAAVAEHYKLKGQFRGLREHNKRLFDRLKKNFKLNRPSFNTSLMAFSTDVIKKDTFSELKRLFMLYKELHSDMVGEQPSLNLLFYEKWKKLPYFYIAHPEGIKQYYRIKNEKVKAIAMHFACQHPWNPNNYYYQEWKHNLDKAEQIDLKNPRSPCKRWTKWEIQRYWLSLRARRLIFSIIDALRLLFLFKLPKRN